MHVAAKERLAYTVEFENLPAASATALLVQIHDQLPTEVQWASVELEEIFFAGQRVAIPPGLSHYAARIPFDGWTWNQAQGWHRGETPLMVDVKAGVDLKTGLLTLNLTCSDTNTGTFPADAYAGFLPPNRPETFYYPTNATDCCGNQWNTNVLVQPGQGYLVYTVKPKASLPTGTVITNAAQIVFDWNDPIDTPVVFNTIDAGAPSSAVEALSSGTTPTFLVNWIGQDDEGGCGIASYDIYVSADGGDYERWLDRVENTSEWFTGEPGVTYRFYSIARDWVGNVEAAPVVADAETQVPAEARLRWLVEGGRLVLLWPAELVAAIPEAATVVQGPYQPLGGTPTQDGDELRVEVPLQQAESYIRLRLP